MVRKGPLKGKRVKVAAATGIKALETVAEDFMLKIFGFGPGEYFITDLSSLHDFVGVDEMEADDIHAKVREVYGLDLADLRDGSLFEIFNRVHEQRRRRNAQVH